MLYGVRIVDILLDEELEANWAFIGWIYNIRENQGVILLLDFIAGLFVMGHD